MPGNLSAEETRARLCLWLTRDLGPVRTAALLERFGSARGVLEASPAGLKSVRGIGPRLADSIVRSMRTAEDTLDDELADVERAGAQVVVRGGAGYPTALAEAPDGPLALVVRGAWTTGVIDRPGVAIVGSRRATQYGVEQAERFGGALAREGLTVVSGGTRGIDAAAHRGAMRAGGRTVVVLGSGLLCPYPPEHAGLFDQIAGSGGAVVSELPCGTGPSPDQFPTRNRIISGLSLGVLVVEAGVKSGALITARQAAEDHGREVMALPGRVDSAACAGSLALLKDGAALITEPADVLLAVEHKAWLAHATNATNRERTESNGADATARTGGSTAGGSAESVGGASAGAASLSPEAARLVSVMEGPMTPDELAKQSGLSASAVRTQLTLLELAGVVVRDGTRVRRASATRP
ncbi:MAG: DNA-processing protein DprA [Planctomycetota bacterium]